MLQRRQTREIDVMDQRPIRNERDGFGVLQLITNFALAIGRVQQRRNRTGVTDGVKFGAELPGVRQEKRHDLLGLNIGSDQYTRDALDQVVILRVTDSSSWRGRSIDDRDLL